MYAIFLETKVPSWCLANCWGYPCRYLSRSPNVMFKVDRKDAAYLDMMVHTNSVIHSAKSEVMYTVYCLSLEIIGPGITSCFAGSVTNG